MSLRHAHLVARCSEVPQAKRRVTRCSRNQFVCSVCRNVVHFLIVPGQVRHFDATLSIPDLDFTRQ